MSELTEYQHAQLTGLTECYIHTHPRVDNYTFPHGAFSDLISQTATINTATPMRFRTTDIADGVSVGGTNSTRLIVPESGVYNIQFSAQLSNADSSEHDIDIWFSTNGTNLVNSNTSITVLKKQAGVNGHAVAAWNIFVRLAKGEYAEIYWSTPNASVFLEYAAAKTSPVRPAIPSVIVTVSFVSDR